MNFLNSLNIKYSSFIEKNILFANNSQLKSKELWKKFVDVFRNKEDAIDNGWRCEYFGKMMRGACLVYFYSKDNELYQILEEAVIDLLTTQDELGRFTSYIDEFQGWDIWGRKYVTSSLLYFYKISSNGLLKAKVINAVKKHADYIVSKIGPNEDQKDILETSNFWGGLNSASICETFIDLFNVTKEEKYLSFAKYIISTGGCSNANLVELAYQNKLAPFEYPVTKAYEMMSFFEGCLEYYLATKEEYYLTVFKNFINQVRKTDITVIGCSGCTHELFDNSFLKQTEESQIHMQETCVTVTWMRLLAKYYDITYEDWCIDELEKSYLNALCGSINDQNNNCYSLELKQEIEPLPFDSYSPLYKSRRGLAVGGFKTLDDGTHYGCCACIASIGLALFPLYGVTKENNELTINYLIDAKITDQNLNIEIVGNYLTNKKVTIKIHNIGDYKKIKIRVPKYFKNIQCSSEIKNGLIETNISKEIEINFDYEINRFILNNKVCFTYGPLVLGQDNYKNNMQISKVSPNPKIIKLKPHDDELVRFQIDNAIFSNYSSLGKNWRKDSLITVWNDIKIKD